MDRPATTLFLFLGVPRDCQGFYTDHILTPFLVGGVFSLEVDPMARDKRGIRGVTDPEEKARRGADIIKMRREKVPWTEIAAKYDITEQRAAQIYKETLASHPMTALAVDEHRMEEQELIEVAVSSLLRMCLTDNPMVTARTKVEAWNSLRGWSEHKAKLLGLNAPAKQEVVTISALDQQIAALEAEMGLLPGETVTSERDAG